MINKSKYRVIGVMSGTSLDGLDLASCTFVKKNNTWRYAVEHATTLKYSASWMRRLSHAHTLDGSDLMELDAAYGRYIGEAVRDFITKNRTKVDFISSHGHTVFHQPAKGFTTQIGNGYSIYAASGLPVVCDFRILDVALGGEGAPLVPIGDRHLFGEFDVCLNMGGIANLSMEAKRKRVAYDVCFCNMPLNLLAREASKTYDKNGAMAAAGSVHKKLLAALDRKYMKYARMRPSFGREIFEEEFLPLLTDKSVSLADRLCTFVESTAAEICRAIRSEKKSARVLCTGGGAFNSYLISRMLEHGGDDITFIIPEDEVVKFKEALVFALLGVLRVRGEVTCLSSVTRASRDSSSGTMIGF